MDWIHDQNLSYLPQRLLESNFLLERISSFRFPLFKVIYPTKRCEQKQKAGALFWNEKLVFITLVHKNWRNSRTVITHLHNRKKKEFENLGKFENKILLSSLLMRFAKDDPKYISHVNDKTLPDTAKCWIIFNLKQCWMNKHCVNIPANNLCVFFFR